MDRGGASEVQPRAILAGPSTSCVYLQPTGAVDVIGVRLEPGAAGLLVEEPIHELVDRLPALEEVSGSFSRDLVEELAEPGRTNTWKSVLERRILRRVSGHGSRTDSVVSLVVRRLQESGGQLSLDELARRGGISARQLERRFRRATGFGPKMFARITRFHAALRRLSLDRSASLASVAARSGYHDQAHLSRDFHRFAGDSPGRFLRERHELTHLFAGEPRP